MKTDELSTFKEALRKENLKMTPQRKRIFAAIADSDQHWEVDDLVYQFWQDDERISRATIYRTLDLLVDHGFVRKIDFGEGRSRYEYAADKKYHDHMICEECGEIFEFTDENLRKHQERLCEIFDFEPSKHVVQIYGLCSDCRSGRNDGE
ncbi:MAG: transcriptional repressor [Candidatus Marinimicrobia bacterium]|nr:transcriptional repressor [Candidatus Neomarinimicrobiota bacterium]MCF7828639.1 transcriptional repressor [Candidatus Neomarinimicrobiota bacterium]MCF7880380.1 transcriptional repressor [Candidatus Neomarinimicrobiota bacterium]